MAGLPPTMCRKWRLDNLSLDKSTILISFSSIESIILRRSSEVCVLTPTNILAILSDEYR